MPGAASIVPSRVERLAGVMRLPARVRVRLPVAAFQRKVSPDNGEVSAESPVPVVIPVTRVRPSGLKTTEDTYCQCPGVLGAVKAAVGLNSGGSAGADGAG